MFNRIRILSFLFALAAPLSAQTISARDSLLLSNATRGKAVSDSIATQVAPGFAQACNSGFKGMGYVKTPCAIFAGLLARDRAADSSLVALALIPSPATHVDTVTLIKHDTTKITTTVITHDTVFMPQPAPTPTPTPTPTPVAVASVSTSLASRSLLIGETTTASVTAKDASGAAITGRVPLWSSSAPSVATVSSTGVVTAIGAGTSQIRATIDDKSSYATLTVTAPPAPTPTPTPVVNPLPDSTAAAIILGLTGPTIPASATPAAFQFYEQKFRAYADTQWTAFGPKWDAGNSISAYERAATFYTWWIRTGDTTYRSRAHQLVVNWRDGYLIPANYATSPHWSQMESLYLDCAIAKDQTSCDAIPRVAGVLSAFPPSSYFDISNGEARIQARVIVALWMAEKLSGQKIALLDTAIVKSLRTVNDSGFTPFSSTCGGSLNYMNGMLYDALTRIHDQRPGSYNTAIEKAALKFGTFLKTSQWRGPADLSFNYVSVLCTGTGSPTSAPDLNGTLLPVLGWLGKTTADSSWFALADQAMTGMKGAYWDGYRQFSELTGSSYRELGYRNPTQTINTGPAPAVVATARRRAPIDVSMKASKATLTRMAADAKRTRAKEAAQHDSLVARRKQR